MPANHADIEAIFFAAKQKLPQDRAAYLDEACRDQPEARKRVEQFLSAQAEIGSFLDSPAIVTAADDTLTERPGTRIGPYKLHEQIGEGGFGIVFMAEQQEPIRRKVAIKIVKPGMDSRQVIARFEAERQALALMDHPNIAKIIDAGTLPLQNADLRLQIEKPSDSNLHSEICNLQSPGRPYFVMELVKGLPITDFCDQSRLTPKERLGLFADVCRAVQHAHQKGIIHRDLKPSNVLVTLQDGAPLVKVIDFGIAKALGQQLTDKTLLTGFAQTIGTPLYMPPEQTALSNADVDTRSDVYALGVLLYELLTGTTPFERERLHAAGYDEMRRIIREEEPPRPSTRLSTLGKGSLSTICEQRRADPRKLGEQVRGELDWIVMKCLEKDPKRRYESASALAADVERYLKDEAVEACPPSVGYWTRKLVKRHKAKMVTVALPLFTFLVGGGVFLWSQDHIRSAAAHAAAKDLDEADIWERQDRWTEAAQALKRAQGHVQQNRLFEFKQQVNERRRNAVMVVGLEEAQLKASGISSDSTTRDYPGADRAYAAAFKDFGLDVALVSAEEIARQIQISPIRLHLVKALDYWAYLKGRVANGDGGQLRAVACLVDKDAWRQKLRDTNVVKDADALKRLAREERALEQPAANLLILAHLLHEAKARENAIDLLRRANDRYPTDFWICYELAHWLCEPPYENEKERLVESVGFYRVALALRPNTPIVYNGLGNALSGLGKKAEAEAAYHKALELKPDYAGAHLNLGLLFVQTDLKKSETAFRKAIAINPSFAHAYLVLGNLLRIRGNLPEAEAAGLRAVELEPNSAMAHNNYGATLADRWKLCEAEEAFRKAVELHPGFTMAEVNLKRVQQYLTDPSYLRSWLVLSELVAYPGKNGAEALDGEQIAAEAKLRPRAGDSIRVGGKTLLWKVYRSKLPILDFETLYGPPSENRTAYAVCYVHSEADRDDLVFKVGSDDQAKLYVNGKEVYCQPEARALKLDQDAIGSIRLHKGSNVLVFKVINQGGPGPSGSLRLVTQDDKTPEGIEYRLEP